MVPIPPTGRRYVGHRSVRLGDIDASGALRLDAVARYAQDVANDDSHDAGLDNANSWVVRRMAIEVVQPPAFREGLTLTTFCSGVGRRWAERRTSIVGADGGRVEVAALWVHLDPLTGVPARFPANFDELYLEAAQGRTVSAKLVHDETVADTATSASWPVRAADLDLLGHVNNAVYWAIVEEWLGDGERHDRRGLRAEIEYRNPLAPPATPVLAQVERDTGADLWLHGADPDTVVYATARIRVSDTVLTARGRPGATVGRPVALAGLAGRR